jgi:hypothetical protein
VGAAAAVASDSRSLVSASARAPLQLIVNTAPPPLHTACSCSPVEVVGPVGRAGAKALHAWCASLRTLLRLMASMQQQPELQQPEQQQQQQQQQQELGDVEQAPPSPGPSESLSSPSIIHEQLLTGEETDANDAGASNAGDS